MLNCGESVRINVSPACYNINSVFIVVVLSPFIQRVEVVVVAYDKSRMCSFYFLSSFDAL